MQRAFAFTGYAAQALTAYDRFQGLSVRTSQAPLSCLQASPCSQDCELPPDADLAFARAAVTEVLSRGGKDASQPWENPRSGARGTVTPIAAAYTQDGHTCRDFLASYVSGSAQAWMQGEACKYDKGAWEVRSLKPWKRS